MEVWTLVIHVSGWVPAAYISYMSQNFRFFGVPNLSILNFRFNVIIKTRTVFET